MALDAVANWAKVTVSTTYDNVATSIVLSSGHGAKLATPPFNLVWFNQTDYPDSSDDPNAEIVRCTGISTDTLTIVRAQESTSASTKNTAGKTYKMIAGLTAKTITDIGTLLPVIVVNSVLLTGQTATSATVAYTPTLQGVYRFTVMVYTTLASGTGTVKATAYSNNGNTLASSSGVSQIASLSSLTANSQASVSTLVNIDSHHYPMHAQGIIVAATDGTATYSLYALIEKVL